jgi:hypothetical protein
VSAEVLAVNLGRTVASRAVHLWLAPRRRDQEARVEMGELIRRRIPGLRAQCGVERQFEQIADAVAARIEPMCRHEFDGLDEDGRKVAIDALTATFRQADLSDAAILGSDAGRGPGSDQDPGVWVGVQQQAQPHPMQSAEHQLATLDDLHGLAIAAGIIIPPEIKTAS